MVGEVKAEAAENRVDPYLQELRDLLERRGLQSGQVVNLPPFVRRIAEVGEFEEEISSLVRAISYSEGERFGRLQMLQLLTSAVGGPDAPTVVGNTPELLGPLFAFVSKALRPQALWSGEEADEPGATCTFELPYGGQEKEASPVELPALETRRGPTPVSGGAASAVRQPIMEDRYLRAQRLAAEQAQMLEAPQEADRDGPNVELETPASSDVLGAPVQITKTDPATVAAETGLTDLPASAVLPRTSPDQMERDGSLPVSVEADSIAPASMGTRWVVPVTLVGLMVLGAGAFLVRPGLPHSAAMQDVIPVPRTVGQDAVSSACVPSISAGSSRVALEERSHWAHRLLDQKLYASALPEFQEIARLDPGYPGVNLDESVALLHMQRLDEAQVAADAQIGITECLAHLPSTSLDSYCQIQYSSAATAGCRPQVAHLREAAQLQSALVHIEIDHWNGAVPAQPAARGATASRKRQSVTPEPKTAPFPAATEDDNVVPPLPRTESSPQP